MFTKCKHEISYINTSPDIIFINRVAILTIRKIFSNRNKIFPTSNAALSKYFITLAAGYKYKLLNCNMPTKSQDSIECCNEKRSEVRKTRVSLQFLWFGLPILSFSWLQEVIITCNRNRKNGSNDPHTRTTW